MRQHLRKMRVAGEILRQSESGQWDIDAKWEWSVRYSGKVRSDREILEQHRVQKKCSRRAAHLVWDNLVQSRSRVFCINSILKLGPGGIIWNIKNTPLSRNSHITWCHTVQKFISGLQGSHFFVGNSSPPLYIPSKDHALFTVAQSHNNNWEEQPTPYTTAAGILGSLGISIVICSIQWRLHKLTEPDEAYNSPKSFFIEVLITHGKI